MLSVCKRAFARAWRATIAASLCITLSGCGRGGVPEPPSTPPTGSMGVPTAQFIAPAQPVAISLGQSVFLQWTSAAATSCVTSESSPAAGDFGGSDNGLAGASITVTPTATGSFTYTITCTGPGGTASANATVTVGPTPTVPPVVTVTVPPQDTTIPLGNSVTITWQSTYATSCVQSQSSIFAGTFGAFSVASDAVTTSGSQTVTPTGTGNFTYTVTCAGAAGKSSASTSITVAPVPGAPPITITAPVQGASIALGQSVAVTWQAPDATVCFVIASALDEMGLGTNSGTVNVTPANTGTVTYGVTCSGSAGRMSFAAAPPVTVTPNFLGIGKISVIGSTADPLLHDRRPTGLTQATQTAGLVTQGDLLTCNFADSGGTTGQGTTIVGLHPGPGATPYRIAQSTQLTGCSQLAALPDGTLLAAAYTADQIPSITPAGVVTAALPAGTFVRPSGIAYASANTLYVAAIDLSRVDGGSIYRVTLNGDTPSAAGAVQIVSGLCTSGAPGALFGPVALMYAASNDMLYIADTSSGNVITISPVSTFTPAGQFVASCSRPPPTLLSKNENAPQEDNINFINGAGLNLSLTPVGMTLLANGDLLVVNGDLPLAPGSTPPAANSVIEYSNQIGLLGQPRQLDNGPPGALSGIAASMDNEGNPIIYFTDANTNSIMVLK